MSDKLPILSYTSRFDIQMPNSISMVLQKMFKAVLIVLVGAVSIPLMGQSIHQDSNDSTISLSGIYYGKNLVVLNEGRSIKSVTVNGIRMHDTLVKTIFLIIDFELFNLKENAPVNIQIVYNKGKLAPVIANLSQIGQYPLMNSKLPRLVAKDIDGNSVNTDSLTGKVLVINTWFVGCVPCAKEMPALNTLVKKYKNNNVVFIALCLTPVKGIKDFLLNHVFDYPIIPETEGYCIDLKCISHPNNIVVNKKGEIVYFKSGYEPGVEIELSQEIEKQLLNN